MIPTLYLTEHHCRNSGRRVETVCFEDKGRAVQWCRARSTFNRSSSCLLRRVDSDGWLAEFRHGMVNDSNDDELPYESVHP